MRGANLLQLIFLSLLVLAGFRCLAVELLRRELWKRYISRTQNEETRLRNCRMKAVWLEGLLARKALRRLALRLNRAFSRPDMMS